ncbi:MAG TPA: hypothetical protein VMW87_06710, partial [Spirochaetia bacterium]|nr:hypothetical protein [Spirochaetia bacterium]
FTDGSSAVSALAGYSGYGRAVVATVGAGGLRVYNLHGTPRLTGSTRASGSGISIADTADAQIYAFVVQDASTIASYDLSDPAHPALFDAFSSPGATAVEVARDVTGRQYAYVADGSGLKILDVFNIGQSLRISKIGISDRPIDVAVVARSGKPLLALVADTGAEVRIFDAANPFAVDPRSLAGVIPAKDARSLTVTTDGKGRPLVYVANGASGVDLYDLTPTVLKAESGKGSAPAELLGSFNTNGTVRSVAAGSPDGRVYVADAKVGMIVLDMSDPKQTRQLGSYPSTDARQVAVDGNYVFLADYVEGLLVLDVSDPAHPKRVAGIAGLRARVVALYHGANRRTYACVVGLNGISLVNVSDPTHPELSGVYATDSAENLKVAGSYAYVAEGYRGLTVLDLSNPERIRKVSTSDLQYAGAVDVSGDFAFVTDPEGLNVVQILIPDWITQARGK